MLKTFYVFISGFVFYFLIGSVLRFIYQVEILATAPTAYMDWRAISLLSVTFSLFFVVPIYLLISDRGRVARMLALVVLIIFLLNAAAGIWFAQYNYREFVNSRGIYESLKARQPEEGYPDYLHHSKMQAVQSAFGIPVGVLMMIGPAH